MSARLTAWCSGCLLAFGMYFADLERPAHILAAFRFGARWDPRLYAMFAGALAVQWFVTHWLSRRGKTLRGEPLRFTQGVIDRKLCLGSLLFGTGWGLAGICPAPAITALLTGSPHVLLFLAGLLAGLELRLLRNDRSREHCETMPRSSSYGARHMTSTAP